MCLMNKLSDYLPEGFDFQQILTKPILDIAARFWDKPRYEAFKICYRSMRLMDDLVDDLKVGNGKVPVDLHRKIAKKINDWLTCLDNGKPFDASQKQLIATMSEFKVPLWPWHKLAKAMIYDLDHNGFKTFSDFLLYSEGAAVSPGSVFMHLCGVRKTGDCYVQPSFDVLKAARPIAIFSYMVHIVRDFQKDQLENLNYFADDLMVENGVTVVMLRQIAAGGEIGPNFRSLMRKYHELTGYHRCKARQSVDNLKSCLEPRYHLSLEVLYSLYLQIFERINVEKG